MCLDIQAGVAQRAGIGRYVVCLATHLARWRDDDELMLFYFDFRRRGENVAPPGARLRRVRWLPGRLVQQAWKRFGAPPFDFLSGPADVYHFPNFIRPPLCRGRSVVTVHDLSFLRFPEAAEARNLRYLTARIDDTIARADAIVTDSETIAAEVRAQWPAAADRVVGVPLALPDGFERPSEEAIAAMRRARGLDRPYVLTVGTIEPRKNHRLLIEVFERMAGFDGDLVLAGRRGWNWAPVFERMAASPRADRIRHIEPAWDAELAALYAGAEAFVLPSLYEGFGFPPLEAMACGTPTVVSAGGSLPEVCGDASWVVGTFNPDEWRAAIEAVIGDPDERRRRIEAGHARVAKFSWTATARRTWAVYRAVAAGRSPAEAVAAE